MLAQGVPFKGRRTREKFVSWQINLLEAIFQADRFPRMVRPMRAAWYARNGSAHRLTAHRGTPSSRARIAQDVRDQLAVELGIAERCVRIWFQNRRQRYRKAAAVAGAEERRQLLGGTEQPPAIADEEQESPSGSLSGHEENCQLLDDDQDSGSGEQHKLKAEPPSEDASPGVGPEASPAEDEGGALAAPERIKELGPRMVVDLAKRLRPAAVSRAPKTANGAGVAEGQEAEQARVLQQHSIARPVPMGEALPIMVAPPGYGALTARLGLEQHPAAYGPLALYPGLHAPMAAHGQPQFIVSNGACYQLVTTAQESLIPLHAGGHPAVSGGAALAALGMGAHPMAARGMLHSIGPGGLMPCMAPPISPDFAAGHLPMHAVGQQGPYHWEQPQPPPDAPLHPRGAQLGQPQLGQPQQRQQAPQQHQQPDSFGYAPTASDSESAHAMQLSRLPVVAAQLLQPPLLPHAASLEMSDGMHGIGAVQTLCEHEAMSEQNGRDNIMLPSPLLLQGDENAPGALMLAATSSPGVVQLQHQVQWQSNGSALPGC
jgi:hypothetical protein